MIYLVLFVDFALVVSLDFLALVCVDFLGLASLLDFGLLELLLDVSLGLFVEPLGRPRFLGASAVLTSRRTTCGAGALTGAFIEA